MHPWLFRIDLPGLGPVAAPTYFAALLLAFVLGTEVALREGRRSSLPQRPLLLTCASLILSGMLGARLAHILFVEPAAYLADPGKLLRLWEGGLVFYGGLFGGLVGLLAAGRHLGVPTLRLGDVFAAPLMLGLAVGRIGCLSAGCCYGRPVDWGTGIQWAWGVTFLEGAVPDSLRGFPLHPTQAYLSANALLLFLLLGRLRRRQRFDGQVLGALLVAYGITRSMWEVLRLDLERAFVAEAWLGPLLSTSQALSIPVVVAGFLILLHGARRSQA
jgi:phosphatidylglycerol:prolipoprotein diacylglycerol transferase